MILLLTLVGNLINPTSNCHQNLQLISHNELIFEVEIGSDRLSERLRSKNALVGGPPDPPAPTQRHWHLALYLCSAQVLHKPSFRQLLGVHPRIENHGENPGRK